VADAQLPGCGPHIAGARVQHFGNYTQGLLIDPGQGPTRLFLFGPLFPGCSDVAPGDPSVHGRSRHAQVPSRFGNIGVALERAGNDSQRPRAQFLWRGLLQCKSDQKNDGVTSARHFHNYLVNYRWTRDGSLPVVAAGAEAVAAAVAVAVAVVVADALGAAAEEPPVPAAVVG
jgi:hypothetical protein